MGDVEEAKACSECHDCSAGIYVYNQDDYPEDTGPICFACLKKRYQRLRAEVDKLTRDLDDAEKRYCTMLDERDDARRSLNRFVNRIEWMVKQQREQGETNG